MKFRQLINEKVSVKDQKAKLEKAVKKIPMKYRKGLDIRLLKNGRHGQSYYDGYRTIYIGDSLVKYKFMDISEYNKIANKDDITFETGNVYDLNKKHKEYSFQFLVHTLAHEIGHYLYDIILKSQPTIKQKVGTTTVNKYEKWVQDKGKELIKVLGHIPKELSIRIHQEKFSEMFRLFITEGKYKAYFKKLGI